MECARGASITIQVMNALLFPCAIENLPDSPFKDKSENTFINMSVPKDNTKIENVSLLYSVLPFLQKRRSNGRVITVGQMAELPQCTKSTISRLIPLPPKFAVKKLRQIEKMYYIRTINDIRL